MRPRFSRFNRCESVGAKGREGIQGDLGGTETYPFCSSTSLRPATCQTILLTLYSQNINKEPATQRARSKYNVPPDLPSLLPRFTAILVLHDPYYRVEHLLPSRETSLFPSHFHTFHLLILSHFPSFIPLLILRVAPFSLGSFFALGAFGEILIPLCQLHSRTSRA